MYVSGVFIAIPTHVLLAAIGSTPIPPRTLNFATADGPLELLHYRSSLPEHVFNTGHNTHVLAAIDSTPIPHRTLKIITALLSSFLPRRIFRVPLRNTFERMHNSSTGRILHLQDGTTVAWTRSSSLLLLLAGLFAYVL